MMGCADEWKVGCADECFALVDGPMLPYPVEDLQTLGGIESRSLQLEMNGTWHERYCPTPPHPSPLNAEHRVQESSTRDERDVTWTLLPHPTPPIPPWMQSTESRRWTGRDMNVIAPPHPTHPPLNAEHRVQESATWDERDVTWTFLLHLTPPIPPWMQSIEPESEVQVNQNPSRKWTLRVASEPEVQVNQNPSRKWTLCRPYTV